MANPQKEDGYTAIANEIMEALAHTRMPGRAWQVLTVVLRNTYGWNRKKAKMSFTYIANATKLDRSNVNKQLKLLLKMNIIGVVEIDHTQGNIYQFNKDFSKWKVWSKSTPVVKKNHTSVVKDNHTPVVENDHKQSNSIKAIENNTNTAVETAGFKDEVNLIFDVFYKSINPQVNYARKDSRDAASWLIAKYGFEHVLNAATYACQIFAEKYAPQIKTPAELKDKWANLVKFKIAQEQPKKGVIKI